MFWDILWRRRGKARRKGRARRKMNTVQDVFDIAVRLMDAQNESTDRKSVV